MAKTKTDKIEPKTIEVKIKNADTVFSKDINYTDKLELNQVVGTVLNDFFKLLSLQGNKAVKVFNLSKPFDLVIKTDDISIDTTQISTELKTKFKVTSKAKSKKRFANNFFSVVKYCVEDTQVVSFEDLLAGLG